MSKSIIQKNLSCVIPSIGNKKLIATLNRLLSGTYIPAEVIISLPPKKKISLAKFNYNTKIRVINGKIKGQVPQRIFGIKKARYNLILQSDDDIYFEKNTLEKLINSYERLNKKSMVAPLMIYNSVKINLFKLETNKHQCGNIDRFGNAHYIKNCCLGKKIIKTNWLPGGCLLSEKKNFIIKNFFPFKGKAYNEDLIDSFLRNKKKISHFVITNSKIYLKKNYDPDINTLEVLKYIKTKSYYFKLSNRKTDIFFYLSCFKIIIGSIIKPILKFIKVR